MERVALKADVLYIRPSHVHYCTDTISSQFRDGRAIIALFESLLYQQMDIFDLEPIQVMFRWGCYWCIHGNHRLYVIRKLEQIGFLKEVPMHIKSLDKDIFDEVFTTRNNGIHVRVRDDNAIDEKLEKIAAEFRFRGGAANNRRFGPPGVRFEPTQERDDMPPLMVMSRSLSSVKLAAVSRYKCDYSSLASRSSSHRTPLSSPLLPAARPHDTQPRSESARNSGVSFSREDYGFFGTAHESLRDPASFQSANTTTNLMLGEPAGKRRPLFCCTSQGISRVICWSLIGVISGLFLYVMINVSILIFGPPPS